jgi:hypothetical protein
MYSVLYTFSNIDDMRLTRGGSSSTKIAATIMGNDYPISTDFTIYEWDSASTASESIPNIVWPTDLDTMAPSTANGRWRLIETVGRPQVNSDWSAVTGISSILNKPTLFSGSYADLTAKPTYAAVATSGSYNDLTAKPTIPTIITPVQSSSTRNLNTAFQISTTRPSMATYSGSITTTANIAGGQDGSIVLEIASDSGFSTNVQTLSSCRNSQTYTLAVALQGVQQIVTPLHGWVPAGYYVRLRTVSTTGTPVFSFVSGQEVLF